MFLKYFDLYVTAGLKPIAVYKETKQPVGYNWNRNWNPEKWREYFQDDNDLYSMGILLGNIVDVEGDTEEANKMLFDLVGDIPHPMYKSSRSIHHLFQTPDLTLTKSTYQGIEFRGFLHHSVVPPSIHISGSQYKFLRGTKFPIPEMPLELMRFYFDHKIKSIKPRTPKKVVKKKPGYINTQCKICYKTTEIHKKRLSLEVQAFQFYGLPWNCHKCRKIDVREDCRRIRKEMEHGDRRMDERVLQGLC
jgi:hypothetical protein